MGAQTIKRGNIKMDSLQPIKTTWLMIFYSTPLFLFYILATKSLGDSEQQYIYNSLQYSHNYRKK